MKVLLAERSSSMSFLELPLLVVFMHNRMSGRTAAQSAFSGTVAPNAPVYQPCHEFAFKFCDNCMLHCSC